MPTTVHHAHLTKEERIEIQAYLKAGLTQTQIALNLKKSKSTISRELTRNKDPGTGIYTYSLANRRAVTRRIKANQLRRKILVNGEIEQHILSRLKTDWSPQQIAGRLTVTNPLTSCLKLSHQTIYDYIYLNRPGWTKYLRILGRKGKYRRKHGTKVREKLREEQNKKRIDVRPESINSRTRLGDFEGDTIVGAEKTIHILTHVDRKSGFLLADKVEVATSEQVQILTLQRLSKLPRTKVRSITYDNGVQFNKHQDTEQKLQGITKNQDFKIYFAYPYHSWERGSSENTNGLLRQYYPKKIPFQEITQSELDKVVKLINNRPRKRLNYLTPEEVFRGKKSTIKRLSLESKVVAFRD